MDAQINEQQRQLEKVGSCNTTNTDRSNRNVRKLKCVDAKKAPQKVTAT